MVSPPRAATSCLEGLPHEDIVGGDVPWFGDGHSKVIDKVADEIEHVEKHFEKAPEPVDRDDGAHYSSITNFFKVAGEEEANAHETLRQLV